MNVEKPPASENATEEISSLIEILVDTERRLEELTGGELDTVSSREGKTFLLQRAQEQLRNSEAAKQAALLNALPAHIALLDIQGVIISVNQAWRRFADANVFHAPGHGVGTNYLAVCDQSRGACSSEAHQVAVGVRAVLSGAEKSFSIEYPCHAPLEKRWFLLTVTPLADDHLNGAAVMHLNITERKQAEETLRLSEDRLRAALSASGTGTFRWDIRTNALDWDDSLHALFGLPQGQTVRSLETFLSTVHPEDRPGVIERCECCAREGVDFRMEFRVLWPDGSLRWLDDRGKTFSDSNGRPLYMTGACMDITERKRVDAELENTHRELLEVSRKAGMAEVATGVLHNVGNVLNSVNVSATLVVENTRKSKAPYLGKVAELLNAHSADLGVFITTDPKGRQLPGMLTQLAEHLAGEQERSIVELESLRKNIGHIKDIVAMQQSYAKVSGVTEIISVTELIEDALRMNAGALQRHRVEVVREYAEVPPVTIEKHKVLQILVNLIRNAKYACDDSDGKDKQLKIRVSQAEAAIRIAVIDNGIGIPPENLKRIFNHGFTTRKQGHGFGLHSGALAAKELGGSLNVLSDGLGKGATFLLELPLAREPRDQWNGQEHTKDPLETPNSRS